MKKTICHVHTVGIQFHGQAREEEHEFFIFSKKKPNLLVFFLIFSFSLFFDEYL